MHRANEHPAHIDGYRFARTDGRIAGTVPLAGLPRLHDLLSDPAGDLSYRLSGTRDASGRLALRLEATGELQLTCQRCLGPLAFPVRLDSLLVLARSESDIAAKPEDPDGPEWVVGGEAMPVLQMVEDEVLLAVPHVPRHDVDACVSGVAGRGTQESSAFKGLRGLLDGSGGRAKS
jgi:uncharacterized protein